MTDKQMEQIVEDLKNLGEKQLYAGLAVISKDLARYLESNPQPDAYLFNSVYSGFSAEERESWGGRPFFDPAEAHSIPTSLAEEAAHGAFDLSALKDPDIVHEWTVYPGRRLLERFGHEFKMTICGPNGPYEQFENSENKLVAQAQLPASIATSILAAGISVATLWYPLAVYIALLLIKTGLATYCREGDT